MHLRRTAALLVTSLAISSIACGQESRPGIDELWKIVQQQQAEIDALRAEIRLARRDVEETNDKVEATGDYVESLASLAEPQQHRTSIGGYGELHYNQVESASGDGDEIDFHRFVLFLGHEFNDRVRFFSEVELEHSAVASDAPGEVELEQAYIDFALGENLSVRGGLFLLPLGILNETHEPPAFYGVERNEVESIILPSTWWEAGAALNGRFGNGFSWDAAMHSGLAISTTGNDAFRIRSGRQAVAEAPASDPAYTLRLKYTGVPGLELAASYQYQFDPSQISGDGLDSGQLFTAHAIYQRNGFGMRALYGVWDLKGLAVEAANADRQDGWYLEPSYRLTEKWGFYARYEDLDATRDQDKFTQSEVGVNFWPTDGVVLKMDYRNRDYTLVSLAGSDFDAIDLGFGYAF
jgi:hypothetical protein